MEAIIKAQPDAVLGICIAKSCAALVKQLRAAARSRSSCRCRTPARAGYVKDLGKNARGVIVTQVYPYPFSDVPSVSKEFRKLAADYNLAHLVLGDGGLHRGEGDDRGAAPRRAEPDAAVADRRDGEARLRRGRVPHRLRRATAAPARSSWSSP